MVENFLCNGILSRLLYESTIVRKSFPFTHGLRTPREEIAFTARPKIHSHSQIFRYGGSIFCLPHRPNFSDIFDLCLHWVSVVRRWRDTYLLKDILENNSDLETQLLKPCRKFVTALYNDYFCCIQSYICWWAGWTVRTIFIKCPFLRGCIFIFSWAK